MQFFVNHCDPSRLFSFFLDSHVLFVFFCFLWPVRYDFSTMKFFVKHYGPPRLSSLFSESYLSFPVYFVVAFLWRSSLSLSLVLFGMPSPSSLSFHVSLACSPSFLPSPSLHLGTSQLSSVPHLFLSPLANLLPFPSQSASPSQIFLLPLLAPTPAVQIVNHASTVLPKIDISYLALKLVI